MKKTLVIALVAWTIPLSILAQNARKRVLFLGNSFTSRNDLPLIVSNIASSRGDTLIIDSNVPSAHTLLLHTRDATTLAKIAVGNWDFVVLQEQSQRPALPEEVRTRFFPNAKTLDSLINLSNRCGETMFYMTWGWKNGDTENCGAYEPVCTYEGMDSLLALNYTRAADSNRAVISPVGAVWKRIRQQFPSIELYNADAMHPSVSGSYAAALCFYTCIFRKNPTLVSYNHGLTTTEANNVKAAVKAVVFDNLSAWRIGNYNVCSTPTVNLNEEPPIAVYPNPVTDRLYLTARNVERLSIVNVLGQVQQSVIEHSNTDTISLDFSSFKPGFYWVLVVKDGKTQSLAVSKP